MCSALWALPFEGCRSKAAVQGRRHTLCPQRAHPKRVGLLQRPGPPLYRDLPSAAVSTRSAGVRRLVALNAFGFSIPLIHAAMEPGLLGAKILELAPDARNTALGGLTFVGLAVAVVAQPIVGALSDGTRSRWGPRMPWMVGGVLLSGLAGASTVVAPSLLTLVLAYCLVQFSANTIQGPWQALVPDELDRSAHGRAAAIKSVLEIAAAVAGRAITGEILGRRETWGDLSLWIVVAIPLGALLVSLPITFGATSRREGTTHHRGLGGALRGLVVSAKLLKERTFALWFVNRVLFWGAFIVVSAFLLFFVMDVLGLEEAEAQAYVGWVSAALGTVLVVAVLVVGAWSDRIGRRPFIVAGGLLAALGTFGLLFARDPILVSVCALPVGLGCGLYMAASWALITEIVAVERAAQSLGLANIATAGASALVRLPAGALVDHVNASSDGSLGYLVVYGLAGVAFVLSSLVALALPGAKPRAPGEPSG